MYSHRHGSDWRLLEAVWHILAASEFELVLAHAAHVSFPSAAHLISWACTCPRSDESAGKRRSTRIRKGSPWLKTTLVQAA